MVDAHDVCVLVGAGVDQAGRRENLCAAHAGPVAVVGMDRHADTRVFLHRPELRAARLRQDIRHETVGVILDRAADRTVIA